MRDLSREQHPPQRGGLPSDTITNPRGSGGDHIASYKDISTRSGKVLDAVNQKVVEPILVELIIDEVIEEEVKEEKEAPIEVPIIVEREKEVHPSVKKGGEEPSVEKATRESFLKSKGDPGAFTIPFTIGHHDFARALCDNGASINLMPLAIYKQDGLGTPRPTSMRLQMADRTIKRPVGVVDDILVRVGEFLLPADFVILDCAVDKEVPIILGRPFIATGRALMDSKKNEIKVRVNNEEVTFQASKGLKLPSSYESISVVDSFDEIDEAVEHQLEEEHFDETLSAILVNFEVNNMHGYIEVVNSLTGQGSYSYEVKKLSVDLDK
ncbi:uncharacterized protein LOC132637147 [Lycium barbarum]|uniref:uncharacterized protein LOC132637147 n=1 Tax=Lycium barbarum TaxID=112863 RepID=UPI00293F4F5D|nr:uncharacterized protein LOC132637147 [Lycium barbarum]